MSKLAKALGTSTKDDSSATTKTIPVDLGSQSKAPPRVGAYEDIGSASHPTIVIESRPGWKPLDVAEAWRYRELLYFLIWRDVKVRYKQTVLGAAWAVLQPLATMIVFTIFIGRVASSSTTDLPYSVYTFLGLVPWTFFANAVTGASSSVVGNQNLIAKVYFPRIFIPIGTAGAGLVDFAIASSLFIPVLGHERIVPALSLIAILPISLLLFTAAVGIGTFLAALTVAYRDFRYVVPLMIQLWMFATPCIYLSPDAYAGSRLDFWLPFNPAFGLILNFRYSLTGHALDIFALSVSALVAIASLLCGIFYFRSVEQDFADIV
jgi:lipopolysaccharide transport system permease protein